jgi:hypothetical protein
MSQGDEGKLTLRGMGLEPQPEKRARPRRREGGADKSQDRFAMSSGDQRW